MSNKETTWAGPWVARKIKDRDEVQDVEVVESQVLAVKRNTKAPFMLGTIAVDCVDGAAIRKVRTENNLSALSFVVNIPKDSFWTGEAIDLVSHYSIAFGGMGDLYRALSLPVDVRQYRNPEFAFVENALRQHDIVTTMTRIHDRKYALGRQGLPDFTIVLINEYELTKDHVRRAKDRYGSFDAILITNPNGNATKQATKVANSMHIFMGNLCKLMGRINRW